MGSGQSARKLTISNEEEVGVIKVSNAIVQRLAQRAEEKAGIKQESSTSQDIRSNTTNVVPQTAQTAGVAPSFGYPVYYYPELTMSALQIQQQKEEELKQQDQYWEKRLRNLEDSYQAINRILEDEYNKATQDISIAITAAGQKIVDIQDNTTQPCLENSNKVLKCYQDHPKETLKCSDLVEEFANCVWNVHYTRVIETRS